MLIQIVINSNNDFLGTKIVFESKFNVPYKMKNSKIFMNTNRTSTK